MLAVGGTGGWTLAHFFCSGQSPLQAWQPNPLNPVVKNGQLFASICAEIGKHCQQGMGDEGTPEIVEKLAGEFYVTFHGYDYARKQAARGVARTRDFVTWETTGGSAALSGDVMFSSSDCQWAEVPWAGDHGCIGSGQASIVGGRSGYKYQVSTSALPIALPCAASSRCFTYLGIRSLRWPTKASSAKRAGTLRSSSFEKNGCNQLYLQIAVLII